MKKTRLLPLMLVMFIVAASSHFTYAADTGFVNMENGATAVVGKPFTIRFVPAFDSNAYKFATIEIVDPDRKLTSQDFPYKNMYETIEYTFTPEKVGNYTIKGYSSIRTSRVERNYIMGTERTITSTTRTTAIKEAILVVTEEKTAGKSSKDGSKTDPADEAAITTLTAKAKTFKAGVKNKKYVVTLKSGKTPIKGAKLTLKVNGKTYRATTNNSGKATFKITKLTKKGTFTAVIKFAGNKNYKATSKNVKIKVKK